MKSNVIRCVKTILFVILASCSSVVSQNYIISREASKDITTRSPDIVQIPMSKCKNDSAVEEECSLLGGNKAGNCQCKCSKGTVATGDSSQFLYNSSTFMFIKDKWKCQGNEAIRKYAGCSLSVGLKSYENEPIFTISLNKSGKYPIYNHADSGNLDRSSCTVNVTNSFLIKCHGHLELMNQTVITKRFSFEADKFNVENLVVSNSSSLEYPLPSGGIIKLGITCGLGHDKTHRCMVLKAEGNIICPLEKPKPSTPSSSPTSMEQTRSTTVTALSSSIPPISSSSSVFTFTTTPTLSPSPTISSSSSSTTQKPLSPIISFPSLSLSSYYSTPQSPSTSLPPSSPSLSSSSLSSTFLSLTSSLLSISLNCAYPSCLPTSSALTSTAFSSHNSALTTAAFATHTSALTSTTTTIHFTASNTLATKPAPSKVSTQIYPSSSIQTTPDVPTKVGGNEDKSTGSDASIIGFILAGILVLVIIIFTVVLLIMKRRKKQRRQRSQSTAYMVENDSYEQVTNIPPFEFKKDNQACDRDYYNTIPGAQEKMRKREAPLKGALRTSVSNQVYQTVEPLTDEAPKMTSFETSELKFMDIQQVPVYKSTPSNNTQGLSVHTQNNEPLYSEPGTIISDTGESLHDDEGFYNVPETIMSDNPEGSNLQGSHNDRDIYSTLNEPRSNKDSSQTNLDVYGSLIRINKQRPIQDGEGLYEKIC